MRHWTVQLLGGQLLWSTVWVDRLLRKLLRVVRERVWLSTDHVRGIWTQTFEYLQDREVRRQVGFSTSPQVLLSATVALDVTLLARFLQ